MRRSEPRAANGFTAAVASAGLATVVTMLPPFLTAALVVPLREELAFGAAGLGIAVAAPRLTGAVLAPALGPLADRIGAPRSIRLVIAVVMVVCFGIAMTVNRFEGLVAWLAIGGVALGLSGPAANRLLATAVTPRRLGTAFGIKQSAPPAAAMLAGISVPLLGLTLGWRSTYLVAGILAATVLFGVRPGVTATRPPTTGGDQGQAPPFYPRRARRALVLMLAVSFGLATSVSATVTAFFVDAAVLAGAPAALAGTMLAVASLLTIGVRVVAGITSDRIRGGHLSLCSALIAGGSVGVGLLATAEPHWMAGGLILALAGTWGFGGVFHYAIVRSHADAPGAITGAVFPGALLGATLGPALFGLLVESHGYTTGWITATGIGLVAALAMFVTGPRLVQQATGRT